MIKSLSSHLYTTRELFSQEVRRRGIERGFNAFRHTLKLMEPFWGSGGKVLDVGAGAGVVTLSLAETGAECHVLDTWYEYAEESENQMGSVHEILERFRARAVHVNQRNILDLPWNYPDNSFDFVLFLDVIEHLPESPDRVLEDIHRVLKPGGILVLTTPNICCLANRLRLLAGETIHFPLNLWYGSHPFTGHYREYTIHEVQEMLRLSRFELLKLDLSDMLRFNTRFSDGTWDSRYRINSFHQLSKALYLAAVQLKSSLRYGITTISRKQS